ncbi:iron dicitrate transport regulator FecR [Variovorax sp. KBW07]|uniref:FecR family protein n=1 Tax=Variovorax sp. KBW07 TaxID=2153358 RepID=UPI000F55B3BF|nr:FecR domain-containing protein [Variovorax sp. KBW07]RQO62948.1 iron dicitrate transport regulator FecR [Variovorax sp. KBW07]
MNMQKSPDDRDAASDLSRRQARVWLRTLSSGDVKPWDAEAFKRWLDASPAHKEAFREVKARWTALKPAVGEMLRTNPQAAEFHARTLEGPGLMKRRAFLGATLGTAAAVAGVAVFQPPARLLYSPGEWRADFRTAVGEQQALTLAGSVGITLNTQTSIRRQVVDGNTVGIDLLAGEAAVDMPPARRAGSPAFSVVAGVGRSLAEAGRFEVRHLAGKVCVTCIEGSVRVEHPAGAHALGAGQQAVYDAAALSGIGRVDVADAAAWRRGELVFSNTRLAEVIDEINRYRAGRVVLMNTRVQDNRVSGRFVIKALDSALAQLQHNFDLSARTLPGGLLILA